MSESNEDLPKITEVKPDDFPEILEQLKTLGLLPDKDTYFPFELHIKLTDERQIDVSVKWDGEQENVKDIAIILDSLTSGYLDQQIVLALKMLASGNAERLDGVKRLLRRWLRLKDERDDSPYVDSFQPITPPSRGH